MNKTLRVNKLSFSVKREMDLKTAKKTSHELIKPLPFLSSKARRDYCVNNSNRSMHKYFK